MVKTASLGISLNNELKPALFALEYIGNLVFKHKIFEKYIKFYESINFQENSSPRCLKFQILCI